MSTASRLTHKDLPVYEFASSAAFHDWLSANFERDEAFWLRFYKKASGIQTVQQGEAVDEALCYGWIDGLVNGYDEVSYLIRFTPRRPKSVWSKINVAKVEALIASGRMQPSGLAHVDAAKLDGRWDVAY